MILRDGFARSSRLAFLAGALECLDPVAKRGDFALRLIADVVVRVRSGYTRRNGAGGGSDIARAHGAVLRFGFDGFVVIHFGILAVDDVLIVMLAIITRQGRLRPRFRLHARLFHQRLRLGRERQGAVMHAEPFEQCVDLLGQIAAQAQETPCSNRQFRDQGEPLGFRQPCGGKRGRRDVGLRLGEMRYQRRIVQAASLFADDFRPFAYGNDVGQRIEPQACRSQQAGVAARLRASQQVEKLAILRARPRAGSRLLAQDGGKAIVELHGGVGAGLRRETGVIRRAIPTRRVWCINLYHGTGMTVSPHVAKRDIRCHEQ